MILLPPLQGKRRGRPSLQRYASYQTTIDRMHRHRLVIATALGISYDDLMALGKADTQKRQAQTARVA